MLVILMITVMHWTGWLVCAMGYFCTRDLNHWGWGVGCETAACDFIFVSELLRFVCVSMYSIVCME